MFGLGKKRPSSTSNPFINTVDIQPGISPEILEESPSLEEEGRKAAKPPPGLLRGLFGYTDDQPAQPSLQESYRHSIYERIQTLLPTYGASNTNGCLSKEEFLKAGDHLVANNRNWEWSLEPEKMDTSLPPNKQFLINRGLECQVRINESAVPVPDRFHLDMENNELWLCPPQSTGKSDGATHVYDVSLTYDPVTHTPRVWLLGYSHQGVPLMMEEVARDIYVDFVGTVATMIPHPFTGVPNVSIHPCRHAESMSRLINRLTAKGEAFEIDHYLVHFLRLITCIIPSINLY